jgi:8-oxo-dGTP pyrophosphatase MutT (NUDIX family)
VGTDAPIRAAGGIVRSQGPHGDAILVVRRRRYAGDVSLPKGKVKAGESLEETALREVREETGYDVRILEKVGTTTYVANGRPKVVSYFLMEITSGGQVAQPDEREIERIDLMTPPDAISALTYQEDRDLIASVFGLSTGG